jgi:magnesium transporter
MVILNQNTVTEHIQHKRFEQLRSMLLDCNAVDIALLLRDIPAEDRALAFRLLPKGLAVQVFEHMEPDQQHQLLEAFTTDTARDLVMGMSPDDRAALLDEVPASVASRLVRLLSPRERKVTLELLGYEEGTAGRLMTPYFVGLRDDMTVGQALERIRRMAHDRETIYYAYVVDGERHLLGAVSLKDLVLTHDDTRISEMMTTSPKYVMTYTDQEDAARLLQDYDLLAVPVVDSENRLVGIVTWDDLADVMEEEATEDIYRYGAVEVPEEGYFRASLLNVARRRVVWLFLLIAVNTVTGSIIAGQSDLLQEVVILAAFVPLLIGTGGNVGAQSSTVEISGLATGEVGGGRAAFIVGRELAVGLLLGALLGLLVVAWAYLLGRELRVAIIVGVTLLAISSMAAMVGGALPFVFRVFKIDPAMVSAPFITTVMDIFGVTLYFLIAHLLLRL